MAFAEDQHPVGDFGPRCEHEPFWALGRNHVHEEPLICASSAVAGCCRLAAPNNLSARLTAPILQDRIALVIGDLKLFEVDTICRLSRCATPRRAHHGLGR
jgi:hypothetical protein